MASCASCGAPILWARTGSGKLIPLDADPVDNGNVELGAFHSVQGVPDFRDAKVWGSAHRWPDGTRRYRSHFVNCPQAERWRRG
jgi:hypothetical protein